MNKKLISKIVLMTLLIAPLTSFIPLSANAAAPNWDTTGTYVISMDYLGNPYSHDMNLTQDNAGNLTGNGGSPSGSNVYTWTITSGTVSADTIDFMADYTATPDAVTPQTVMHVMGTIAQDGTMSGTWTDNYQGGQREGTWASVSGNAELINDDDQDQETVKVTIVKYIDGSMATANSAQSMDFPMNATWDAQNLGAGSGQFNLSASGFNNDPTPYQAVTSDMTTGADYSVNEVTGGSVVADACTTEGAPYALTGYSTGNTLQEAQQATPTLTAPSFTNMTSDKFVIVWNIACDASVGDGDLEGDVTPGNGVLTVTSITVVKGDSTADGTFAGGWKYLFHVTDPNNEPKIAMKFADWLSGANIIPVANNMRISSAQADNGNATILLTAANTYSTPKLNMVTDLDAGTIGRQVEILVEVSVPVGTPSGTYSTTYGIQSTP